MQLYAAFLAYIDCFAAAFSKHRFQFGNKVLQIFQRHISLYSSGKTASVYPEGALAVQQ